MIQLLSASTLVICVYIAAKDVAQAAEQETSQQEQPGESSRTTQFAVISTDSSAVVSTNTASFELDIRP